jgi:imidazolonepropionase-like amidohydrolase
MRRAPKPIELRGRIFDGVSNSVRPGRILIDGISGQIDEVSFGSRSSLPARRSGGVLATDGTILPGLVDCHIHLIGARAHDLAEWNLIPPVLSGLRCVPALEALLRAGFTSVRDLGSKAGPALRQAVDEGDLTGPRIVTSGRSLAETGGDDDMTILPEEVSARLAYSVFCDGPWAGRKAVRQVVRDGANVIKLYASGSFLQGGTVRPQLSFEEISAIVQEAHKMGLRVAAHAYKEEAIRAAVEGGVDSIEHGIGLTEDVCELMRKRGVFYVPTLSVYDPIRRTATGEKANLIRQHFTKDIRLALASELKIAGGTDFATGARNYRVENFREAVQLVDAGLSPVQALRAMTSVGAECLGFPDLGVLREGATADLVVVSGRPDRSVDELAPERVEHVIRSGRLLN